MSSTNHNPHDDPASDPIAEAELLSAYLDGELTADECARVERQLTSNPVSRQLLAELRAVSDSLHQLPTEAAPSGLGQSVLQATRNAAQRGGTALAARRSEARWPRGWALATLAAVAAVLLLMVLPSKPENDVAKSEPRNQPPADSRADHSLRDRASVLETMPAKPPASFEESAPEASLPVASLPSGGIDDSGLDGRTSRGEPRAATVDGFAGGMQADNRALDAPPAERNPAVVVRVGLRREAFANRFVESALGDNGIAVRPTPALLTENLRRMEQLEPLQEEDEQPDAKANQPPPASGFGVGGALPGLRSIPAHEPLEVLLVNAPMAPVVDFVSELNRDYANCLSINIEGAQPTSEPYAYNDYQQQLIDNMQAYNTLNSYSRSGAFAEQQLAQRSRIVDQAPRRQEGKTKSAKAGKATRGFTRGVAYKMSPEGMPTDDKNVFYSQLSLLANQAVSLNKEVARHDRDSDTPENADGFRARSAERFDISESRVPLVLLCSPADPPTASEAAASEGEREVEPLEPVEPVER